MQTYLSVTRSIPTTRRLRRGISTDYRSVRFLVGSLHSGNCLEDEWNDIYGLALDMGQRSVVDPELSVSDYTNRQAATDSGCYQKHTKRQA